MYLGFGFGFLSFGVCGFWLMFLVFCGSGFVGFGVLGFGSRSNGVPRGVAPLAVT